VAEYVLELSDADEQGKSIGRAVAQMKPNDTITIRSAALSAQEICAELRRYGLFRFAQAADLPSVGVVVVVARMVGAIDPGRPELVGPPRGWN